MTVLGGERASQHAMFTVSIGAVAWGVATALFIAMRLGLTWQQPVGGDELVHLSGAWNASIGLDDDRFIPTLFQGLASWLFEFTSAESGPRIVAFLATISVPAAVVRLRDRLGNAAALGTLLVLAFDPVAIWGGVAASAYAWDMAIAAWLLVALSRDRLPSWVWAPLGFLIATAGPIPAGLGLAALIIRLANGARFELMAVVPGFVGALAGVALASLGMGRGWEGITVPPIEVFARPFTEDWSNVTATQFVLLYTWPVLLAAIAGLVVFISTTRSFRAPLSSPGGFALLCAAWFIIAFIWLAVAGNTGTALPALGASFAASFVAGPVLARLAAHLLAIRERLAWLALAFAAFFLSLVWAVVVDWARVESVGPAADIARVLVFSGAAIVVLAGIAWFRYTALLFVPALFVGLVPLVSGAFAIASNASSEPLPSPIAGGSASTLRHVALETIEANGGDIVIHSDFRDDLTWVFRDTGQVTVASSVPAEAGVAIWPADASAPEGFTRLDGNWALHEAVSPPLGSVLEYLHWLSERNHIGPRVIPVALYSRAAE